MAGTTQQKKTVDLPSRSNPHPRDGTVISNDDRIEIHIANLRDMEVTLGIMWNLACWRIDPVHFFQWLGVL